MEEVSGQKEQRVYAASSNWNSIGTSVLAAYQGSPVHLALDSAFPDLPIQSHLPQQEMESTTQAILTDSSSQWPDWFHPDCIPGSGKWPLAITMLSSSQLLQKKSQLITKSQRLSEAIWSPVQDSHFLWHWMCALPESLRPTDRGWAPQPLYPSTWMVAPKWVSLDTCHTGPSTQFLPAANSSTPPLLQNTCMHMHGLLEGAGLSDPPAGLKQSPASWRGGEKGRGKGGDMECWLSF